jgi:hypothetical protein
VTQEEAGYEEWADLTLGGQQQRDDDGGYAIQRRESGHDRALARVH